MALRRRPKGNPSPGWAHSVLSVDKQGSAISELMVGLETRGPVELGSEFLPCHIKTTHKLRFGRGWRVGWIEEL